MKKYIAPFSLGILAGMMLISGLWSPSFAHEESECVCDCPPPTPCPDRGAKAKVPPPQAVEAALEALERVDEIKAEHAAEEAAEEEEEMLEEEGEH